MALQIIQQNGIFYVGGKINTATTKNFMVHFDYILENNDRVVINIDQVDEIDNEGIKALEVLTKIAVKNNKSFIITGNRSKDIVDAIDTILVA